MAISSTKVKVCVRCRPLIEQETHESRVCVSIEGERVKIGDKVFSFDHVFNSKSKQGVVYDTAVSSLVEGALQGFNGTIFAYGQTGSGKTYSMVGSAYQVFDKSNEDIGVIPRAINDLFDKVKIKESEGAVVNVRISFIEIYNEDFKDLLHLEILPREILIREDKEGRIFFTGAREESVTSASEALHYLEKGNIARTTAETMMNSSSSRSHAIFTIATEVFIPTSVENEEADEKKINLGGEYVQSKLHIVDLAGSERAKRTGAGGLRLKESVGINQGLLSLGKVIRALTTNTSAVHVPYRESKLTRFLQDSLGGNSRTVMLACISPAEINLPETLNTLQYASRARSVQNKVVANISVAPTIVIDSDDKDVEGNIILTLRAQIQKMHKEIATLKDKPEQSASSPSSLKYKQMPWALNSHQKESLYRDISKMKAILQNELKKLDDRMMDMIPSSFVQITEDSIELFAKIMLSLDSSTDKEQYHSDRLRESIRLDDYRQLQIQLAECHEDLKRDEEIFAEKVKELKQCRKQLKEIERERDDYFAIIQEFKSQSQHANLDVSAAVAVAEPDISQLMEDLELISKEKDKLRLEKERIEQQYQDAIKLATQQKNQYELIQNQLQEKLHDVNDGNNQHQVISSDEFMEKATTQEHRMKELEQDKLMLINQIEELKNSKKISEQEVIDGKKQRLEYEYQLQSVQEQLVALQRQYGESSHKSELSSSLIHQSANTRPLSSGKQLNISPKKIDYFEADEKRDSITNKNVFEEKLKYRQESKEFIPRDEYLNLHHEHEKLLIEYSNQQQHQQQALHEITNQLDQYRDKHAVIELQYKELEQQNAKLIDKLQKWSKVKGFSLDQSISTINISDWNQNYSKKFKSDEIFQMIQSFVDIKSLFQSYHQIAQKRKECFLDYDEVMNELNPLLQTKKKTEHLLKQQIKEIKKKIKNILSQIQEIRKASNERSDAMDMAPPSGNYGDNNRLPQPPTERLGQSSSETLNGLLKEAKFHQEHYSELLNRLENIGVMNHRDKNKIQELQEEIEAVNIELKLHENSLNDIEENIKQKLDILSESNSEIMQSELLNLLRNLKSAEALSTDVSLRLQSDLENIYRKIVKMNLFPSDNNIMGTQSDTNQYPSYEIDLIIYSMNTLMKVRANENEISGLKSKLLKKEEDYDNLMASIHKNRLELMKKQEEMQHDCDKKIEFLLQQLKQAEIRVNMTSSSSMPLTSIDRNKNEGDKFSMTPRSQQLSRSIERRVSDDKLVLCSDVSQLQCDEQGFRPSYGIASHPVASEKRLNDDRVDANIHQEVIRRWTSEKDRRVILEKKISELNRDLRYLRSRNEY